MKISIFAKIKNVVFKAVILSFLLLTMTSPVLANSAGYEWLAYKDIGNVIDGSAHGRLYTINAGKLTNTGKLWVTSADVTATNPPSWFTVAVYKQVVGPDKLICKTAKITPSLMVGSQYAKSYTVNCGTIAKGVYYLYIERKDPDGREVKGSGTISTP